MSSDSFSFLSKHILQDIASVNDALACAGLYLLAKNIIKCNFYIASFIKIHGLSKLSGNRNLIQEYGGEWAVVTGSSEGIGRAYAEELAKRGLNIVLISKDVTKLQNTAFAINEMYGVEVDFISITFDGTPEIYPQIQEYLAGKRIGILVNNVGVMYDYPQLFLEVPSEKLWQLVNVNVAAATMMTHIVLPDMLERQKGAIVNVAAGGCSRPTPQMTVYAATKAYVDLFSRALHYEYKDEGITVQCLMPFYVATRMQRFSSTLSEPSRWIPSASQYARHAVQTLGYSTRTTGYWLHTVQAWVASLFPERLWMWGASRLNSAFRRQAQEKMRSRSGRNLSESAR